MKGRYISVVLTVILGSCAVMAQGNGAAVIDTTARQVMYVTPLFEYPMAPDDLPDISARSNWLMEHFWDNMNFSQGAVSQVALNHAFKVYTVPMQWADKTIVHKSVDALLAKIKKNPTMLVQFTKAAEDNLYAPEAEIWIDDIYLKFVDALLAEKKVPQSRKMRYEYQRGPLARTLTGQPMPPIPYTAVILTGDTTATVVQYTKPYNLVVFGDPTCSDCKIAKMHIETSAVIQRLMADGKLALYYIVPDDEGVENCYVWLSSYPEMWMRGAGTALDETIDMRLTPTLYLMDGNGIILEKHLGAEVMIQRIAQRVQSE